MSWVFTFTFAGVAFVCLWSAIRADQKRQLAEERLASARRALRWIADGSNFPEEAARTGLRLSGGGPAEIAEPQEDEIPW